jgi:hypothetical protein
MRVLSHRSLHILLLSLWGLLNIVNPAHDDTSRLEEGLIRWPILVFVGPSE